MSNLRHLKRLATTYAAYRRTAEVCEYPPTRLWIEPTSHCNLRCSFCTNHLLPKGQKGYMDVELYRKIVDEASGSVHQVNLFHRGESLLHPRLGEMIRYAREAGLQTRIHTNATLLTEDRSAAILDAGLDILSFSFDGYDKQMYEANRINATFEKTMDGIMRFLQMKKDGSYRRPFVVLELMEIGDYSPEEYACKRPAFLSRFEGLPLDKFVVRKPHNWGGSVDTDVSRAGRWLKARRIPCPLLWHAMAIFWDGRVMPCCQDCFGDLQVGDVSRSALMDIWNGLGMRDLRREMAQPQSVGRTPCARCDRMVRTTIAGVPTDYLGRFVSESILNYGRLSRLLPH